MASGVRMWCLGPMRLDNMRRYADIDGFQTAGDLGSRKQDMADFGKAEGDGGMGLNAGPADHSRVRIQAGGDVNGDDGPIQAVQQFNDRPEKPFHLGIESGSQQRIHPDPVMTHVRVMLRQESRVRDFNNRNFQRIQQLQIGRCIAFYGGAIRKEINAYGRAHAGQIAGDDKPVSAVVSPSGNDTDALIPARRCDGRKCFDHNIDNAPAGVFHQHPARKAKGFDGFPVHLLHFRSGYNMHKRENPAILRAKEHFPVPTRNECRISEPCSGSVPAGFWILFP